MLEAELQVRKNYQTFSQEKKRISKNKGKQNINIYILIYVSAYISLFTGSKH